jgi:hypothetical protein
VVIGGIALIAYVAVPRDPSAAFVSIRPTQWLTRGPKNFALVGDVIEHL